jgi:hypothetical protein
MLHVTRRVVLCIPGLALAGTAGAAAPAIPPFAEWVGRTARLRGDGGVARLLLNRDGGGQMAVRLLLLCWSLPIVSWRLGADGGTLRYARASALDRDRLVTGEARILPGGHRLLWIEARAHEAAFDGFDEAGLGGCG